MGLHSYAIQIPFTIRSRPSIPVSIITWSSLSGDPPGFFLRQLWIIATAIYSTRYRQQGIDDLP
jgi:hypothetical protein